MQYEKFFAYVCVMLGAVAAALIAIPLSIKLLGNTQPILIILLAILGAFLGYRRKDSRAFFYTCLIVILIMVSLLFQQGKA